MTTAAGPAAAQTAAPAATARVTAQERQERYEIGQMERVLEGAVEHGVTVTRDRMQALAQLPADLLVSDNAHARGFRLEGYGVFFDVIVPSFETTWTWSLRTLDQNDLGLDSALRTLKTHVKTSGDPDLEQALKRLELQVNPLGTLERAAAPSVAGARTVTGSAASTTGGAPGVTGLGPLGHRDGPCAVARSQEPVLCRPDIAEFRADLSVLIWNRDRPHPTFFVYRNLLPVKIPDNYS